MDQKSPIIQKALIEDSREILLVKRAIDQDYYSGMWDMPGGLLEQGEDALSGLVREVQEETALRITACEPDYTSDNQFNGYKLVYYRCQLVNDRDEVAINKENSAFQWVDRQKILSFDLAPNTRDYLEYYLKDSPK